jgi:hypothetical protein
MSSNPYPIPYLFWGKLNIFSLEVLGYGRIIDIQPHNAAKTEMNVWVL